MVKSILLVTVWQTATFSDGGVGFKSLIFGVRHCCLFHVQMEILCWCHVLCLCRSKQFISCNLLCCIN